VLSVARLPSARTLPPALCRMLAEKPGKPDISSSCHATVPAASKVAAADAPTSGSGVTMQPAASKAKQPGMSIIRYKEILTAVLGAANEVGTAPDISSSCHDTASHQVRQQKPLHLPAIVGLPGSQQQARQSSQASQPPHIQRTKLVQRTPMATLLYRLCARCAQCVLRPVCVAPSVCCAANRM
jgi:hypothetical protein